MTLEEFEREFDIIYENINKGGAPGLVPYEKSVILTQAQEILTKQLMTVEPTLIANLIQILSLTVIDPAPAGFDSRAFIYDIPIGILQQLNEKLVADSGIEYTILPMDRISYDILNSKPYRYPPVRRAWRIIGSAADTGFVEIIPRFELESATTPPTYRVRALYQPEPIILLDVTETIRGVTPDPLVGNETNLDEALHPDILATSVKLAEQHYMDKYGTDGASSSK